MSAPTPQAESLQRNLGEAIDSLFDMVRDVARQEVGGSEGPDPRVLKEEILQELRAELRDEVRAEVIKAGPGDGGGSGSGDLDVEQLLASEEARKPVNNLIQEALQTVLPSLIKRVRGEIDKAFAERDESGGGGSGGGDAASSTSDVINSTEMKEMLEDRFRTMPLYLKQEVIPKAIQQG